MAVAWFPSHLSLNFLFSLGSNCNWSLIFSRIFESPTSLESHISRCYSTGTFSVAQNLKNSCWKTIFLPLISLSLFSFPSFRSYCCVTFGLVGAPKHSRFGLIPVKRPQFFVASYSVFINPATLPFIGLICFAELLAKLASCIFSL